MSLTPQVYRPKQTAFYLGCSVNHLKKLIDQGFLATPSKLNANFVFWTKDQLDDCILKMKEAAA